MGSTPSPRTPRPTGNPERFDADPSLRDDEGRLAHQWADDGVEVSPDVRVVVDAAIADVRSVMTGGGALGVEVEVDVGDLVGLTAAVVADVTRSAG